MHRRSSLDDQSFSDVVRRYGSGATVYELAAHFGVHRNTIAKILEQRGV